MNNNIEEILETCKIQILCLLPFFGILLLKLPIIEDSNKTGTICTDCKNIFYNKSYLESLKKSEIAWTLVHETMHVAYKHFKRLLGRNQKRFNYACDYAIHDVMQDYIDTVNNFNKNNCKDRQLKVQDVISRNQDWLYDKKYNNMSAEQIYELLDSEEVEKSSSKNQFDDHSPWDEGEDISNYEESEWDTFLTSALEKSQEKLAGKLPNSLERLLKSLTSPTINWKDLLYDFLQFEVYDYSFSPPDRRNQSECILPDFNELDANTLKNIIFYIDTSGSISDEILNSFYSEIAGIMDFFTCVQGHIGFFDYDAYELHPFDSIEDLMNIKPVGGGGTSFHAPFNYINVNFIEEVAAIVILTDGQCNYPEENIANGVPVLWLYSEEQCDPPPFGRYAVIKND